MKLEVALSLLLQLVTQVAQLGAAINKARAEGRTDLTDEEVAEFAGQDDQARARLEEQIRRLET